MIRALMLAAVAVATLAAPAYAGAPLNILPSGSEPVAAGTLTGVAVYNGWTADSVGPALATGSVGAAVSGGIIGASVFLVGNDLACKTFGRGANLFGICRQFSWRDPNWRGPVR